MPTIVTPGKGVPLAEHLQPKIDHENGILFHVRTLWLFTRSDLKTVIVPQSVLALSNTLSGSFLHRSGVSAGSMASILSRLPLTVFWIWLNLLMEVIANQRLPGSIKEDAENKPWRPLPSGRLQAESAHRLLVVVIFAVLGTSYCIGEKQLLASALLCSFTWLYNDLDGADSGVSLRNALNACGLLSFSVGATATSMGGDDFSAQGCVWFVLLWWVIFTTVQIQDLVDMVGDKAKGRKSMPLVYGDTITRWSVAMPTIGWSIVCPLFWGGSMLGFACILILGGILAVRVVSWRSFEADRHTWRLWCCWMTVISMLPCL